MHPIQEKNNTKTIQTDTLTIDFNKITSQAIYNLPEKKPVSSILYSNSLNEFPESYKCLDLSPQTIDVNTSVSLDNIKKQDIQIHENSIISDITQNTDIEEYRKNKTVEINFFPGFLYLNLQTIIGYIPYPNVKEITFKVYKGSKVVFKKNKTFGDVLKGNNLLVFVINEVDLTHKVEIKIYLQFKKDDTLFYGGSLKLELNYEFMENILNNIVRHDFEVSPPSFNSFLTYFNDFLHRSPLENITFPCLAAYIPLEELSSTNFRSITNRIDLFEYIAIRKSMLKIIFKGFVDIKLYKNNDQTQGLGTWKRVFVYFIGFNLRIFDESGKKMLSSYSLKECKVHQHRATIYFEHKNYVIEIMSDDEEAINILFRALVTFQKFFSD
ncbi:hypothetical protein CDIK_1765 [Cucumispora dikerogammari]|nr:hypothetical protein CDIK_1765 [Cucumispora dikerogammari]